MTSQIIPVDPFDFIIFGGTGDLSERKLLPSLYYRQRDHQFSEPTRIIEPIPTAEDEIRVTALNAPAAGEEAGEKEEETEKPRTSADWGFDDDDQEESPMSDRHSDRDWLSEVSREERTTLEWPAGEGSDPRERERIDTPRVRHLFPVPEDADWEVRELRYDHYKHHAG